MTIIRVKSWESFRPGIYLERIAQGEGDYDYRIAKVWEENGRLVMTGFEREDPPEPVNSIDLFENDFFRLHTREHHNE